VAAVGVVGLSLHLLRQHKKHHKVAFKWNTIFILYYDLRTYMAICSPIELLTYLLNDNFRRNLSATSRASHLLVVPSRKFYAVYISYLSLQSRELRKFWNCKICQFTLFTKWQTDLIFRVWIIIYLTTNQNKVHAEFLIFLSNATCRTEFG